MDLKVMCKSCQKYFDIKARACSRQDLIPMTEEYFYRNCTHCGNTKEYHVNDVKASQSITSNIIGTAIGLAIIIFVTLFAWNQGYITNIGLVIGALVIGGSNANMITSNANAFNKYRIQATIRDKA